MKAIWIRLLALTWASMLVGADDSAPVPAAPAVVQTGENQYLVGEVRIHAASREIRFPAVVNQDQGALEYALVHENGKVHESLLRTVVKPQQIQVALKLLHYRTGAGDLFEKLLPPGKEPLREAEGERLEILVCCEGKPEIPLRAAIGDRGAGKSLEPTPWIFTGSEVIDGAFQADVEGSIVAIYRDMLAMVNCPHPRAMDDENWYPVAGVLPRRETQVEILIRPWKPEP